MQLDSKVGFSQCLSLSSRRFNSDGTLSTGTILLTCDLRVKQKRRGVVLFESVGGRIRPLKTVPRGLDEWTKHRATLRLGKAVFTRATV